LRSALVIALSIWGAFWHAALFAVMKSAEYADFGRFYYAASLWRKGGSLYAPSVATWVNTGPSTGVHLWNLNPPHVSLVFLPFSMLTVEHAYLGWALATSLSLALSAWLIVNQTAYRPGLADTVLIGAFAFTATPTLAYAGTGNLTGPLTLLITWTWSSWRSGRSTATGIGVGLAWSIKLFFVPLVVYLFAKRQWRSGALAIATGAAAFVLGLAVFGTSELMAWTRALADVQWPWLALNSSIAAPLTRAAYVANQESTTAPEIAKALHIGLTASAGFALTGLVAALRDDDRDRSFLLLLVTCLLTFPLGWVYYWWVFAGPLVASWGRRPIRIGFCASLPGWLIPTALIWPYSSVLFALTIGSVYSWSLLALWTGVVISTLSPSRPADLGASS
jgi:alpha-1,2-mannosyltransferase